MCIRLEVTAAIFVSSCQHITAAAAVIVVVVVVASMRSLPVRFLFLLIRTDNEISFLVQAA